jgi:hypothetical protein
MKITPRADDDDDGPVRNCREAGGRRLQGMARVSEKV